MQITDPKQLFVGQEIFMVLAFDDERKLSNTHIEQCAVKSFTTTAKKFACVEVERTGFLKLDVSKQEWKPDSTYRVRTMERSMQDAGIIPNTYNQHKVFDSLWETQQYIDTLYGINATSADPAENLTKQPLATDYDRAMRVV